MCKNIVTVIFILCCCVIKFKCEESLVCQDDPGFDPSEGPLAYPQFTWLGALQYIHVEKGHPHYFRVPRVVLISPRFVLSTAVDAAAVPTGYALGNVVFGEYQRDEDECQVEFIEPDETNCETVVMLMPIADVLLHPEYKNFGVKNSVALLKLFTPVSSAYMMPVCLPLKDYMYDDDHKPTIKLYRHVDFTSEAPRDFMEERKDIKIVNVVCKEMCYVKRKQRDTRRLELIDRTVCSRGCGLHSGAPTVIHEHTGHWTVVAIAIGKSPCPDPLFRAGAPDRPEYHIPIFPYVSWIKAALSGKITPQFSGRDPFGYGKKMEIASRRVNYHKFGRRPGWIGSWWLGGLRCFDRAEGAADLYRFYYEMFKVDPYRRRDRLLEPITYYLSLEAPATTMIDCVKVGMPKYTRNKPTVWSLYTQKIKLRLPMLRYRTEYRILVEAWGHNMTDD